MKEFILIDHEPWTKTRKERFYDMFKKAGVDLQVLDLSQWLYPGFENPDMLPDESYLTRIYSDSEFSEYLSKKDPSKTIIVEECFRNWHTKEVFKILSDLGFKTIKVELYGNTVLKESLKHKLKYMTAARLLKAIKDKREGYRLNRFYKNNGIGAGPMEIISSNKLNRTLPYNHPDYEKIRFWDKKEVVKKPYIVFSDEYFPYHTDIKYFLKDNGKYSGEKYQATMRRYFDYLEAKYKMPVVIAAHPKSDYKGGEFGNRRIIKYETDNLVNNASMATLHLCNTISYSVLKDVPVAFVATDDFFRIKDFERIMDNLSKNILGLDYYNLDHVDFDKIEFHKVDKERREDYIYSYLTSKETENRRNIDTLWEYLSKM